jgi:hypothetical protein
LLLPPVGLQRPGCMGRDYRMAYNSDSLSAIMAVVSAGLA